MNESAFAPTQKLIDAYRHPPVVHAGSGPKITVNQMVSRVAFLYERIRNAIDYKEEHLFRKDAIQRILKRRLLIHLERRDLARDLIYELIRGRYLPNNALPESLIEDVRGILNKYYGLMKQVELVKRGERRRTIREWLITIESYEIEKLLIPHHTHEAMGEFMYDRLLPHIELSEKEAAPQDKNIQIFAAIHRAMLKSDDAIIRYYLWRLHIPKWDNPSEDDLITIAATIEETMDSIERQVNHPLAGSLARVMKRYSIMFQVLKDVLDEVGPEANALIQSPDVFEARIRRAISRRYSKARTKIRRTVVRSIIYILVTKMIIGLAIEFPYDIFVAAEVAVLPLAINILFHPFLLTFIAMTARVPSEKNTKLIIENINAFIRGTDYGDLFDRLKKPVKKSRLTFFFSLIYLVTYVITFGLIIWGLSSLEFNIVSMVIFILFLSIVSFFGLKVRGIARELIVEIKRENIISSTIDFFAIPVLQLGRWISEKAPKINVFIFILDFILEAPFKTFIEIIEQWFSFIREKREEIY